ncbi:hypothetical protein Taro_034740 [Colocasia esculenta]|uniref:Uncharacterized protein n=1 Tax=Colocasia esculenta TaxID=4460 RepID=A0A843W4T0_COLES|nr:hypothetical protein [Colocasia esculenta]
MLSTGYNQLVDHVGIHGQRRLTEALNKDSLVRRKEYPTESSSKLRESVLGYNQLVDHMGIHGQRRLMEALNKDSLVRQKEYPTESSSKSRESNAMHTCKGRDGSAENAMWACTDHDGPVSSGRQVVMGSHEGSNGLVR